MQAAEEKTLQQCIFNILLFVCQKDHDGSSQLNQKIANRWVWRTMEGVKSMLVRKLVPKKRAAHTFRGYNPLFSFQIKILGQLPNLSQFSLWVC